MPFTFLKVLGFIGGFPEEDLGGFSVRRKGLWIDTYFLTAFYCFAFSHSGVSALDFFLEHEPRASIFTDIYII
jgi:hypothetical protein